MDQPFPEDRLILPDHHSNRLGSIHAITPLVRSQSPPLMVAHYRGQNTIVIASVLFLWTCRQTRSLCDHPLIDLLDLPVLLGDGEKDSRRDDLAVSPEHADQKLFAAVAPCREREDRL